MNLIETPTICNICGKPALDANEFEYGADIGDEILITLISFVVYDKQEPTVPKMYEPSLCKACVLIMLNKTVEAINQNS